MHQEALGGSVVEFDEAVQTRACPFLNVLGETALNEMRQVYEQINDGDYEALAQLSERLAAAVDQKTISKENIKAIVHDVPKNSDQDKQGAARQVESANLTTAQMRQKGKTGETLPVFGSIKNKPQISAETTSHLMPQTHDRNRWESLRDKTNIIISREEATPEAQLHLHSETLNLSALSAELSPPEKAPESTVSDPLYAEVIEGNYSTDNESLPEAVPKELDNLIEFVSTMPELEMNTPSNKTEQIEEHDETPVALASDDKLQVSAVALENEMNSAEGLGLLFETEILETYNQLVDLGSEVGVKEAPDTATVVIDTPSFETFIDIQPAAKEPVTFELIQERSNNQQLEQTFIQLVEYFSTPTEEPEREKLKEIISEIKIALSAKNKEVIKTESELQITPELTEKLILLLRTLGYENPGEVLVNFVITYDLSLLLQAVEYICRSEYRYDLQESLKASSGTPVYEDSSKQRFSKLLIRFIIGMEQVNDSLTV